MYSKGLISTAFISNVTPAGELKFEVATNNRIFTFKAESEGLFILPWFRLIYAIEMCLLRLRVQIYIYVHYLHFYVHTYICTCFTKRVNLPAERNEWVEVLQDCIRGRSLCSSTMNSCSPLTPNHQGFLELKGLRSKLYTVVASDKVFLYKNIEVRTLLCDYRHEKFIFVNCNWERGVCVCVRVCMYVHVHIYIYIYNIKIDTLVVPDEITKSIFLSGLSYWHWYHVHWDECRKY